MPITEYKRTQYGTVYSNHLQRFPVGAAIVIAGASPYMLSGSFTDHREVISDPFLWKSERSLGFHSSSGNLISLTGCYILCWRPKNEQPIKIARVQLGSWHREKWGALCCASQGLPGLVRHHCLHCRSTTVYHPPRRHSAENQLAERIACV